MVACPVDCTGNGNGLVKKDWCVGVGGQVSAIESEGVLGAPKPETGEGGIGVEGQVSLVRVSGERL